MGTRVTNKSKTLRTAKVTVYDWKKCEATYSSKLTQRLMCTYDTNVGPCASDFGDPLVYKNAVYGLFAGGYKCLSDPALVPQGDLSFRVEGTKCEKAGQLFTADKVLENVNYTGTWDYDIAVVKLNKPIKFGKHVKINFWTFPKEDLSFRVGSANCEKGGQLFTADKVLVNENYTGSWDYDIAVVKLNKPIKFSKYVKPIKLGTTSLKPTTKVAIAGWGAASQSEFKSLTLLAAKVTVYDWNKCEETFSSYLTPRVMCTYDTNVGPCASDFGDPLVYKNAVYGLYAGGYDCLFDPAAYVNVPSYVDWVKNTIEK
ncbi:trypsin theta-like [Homalodisca vitripennis]|uniref:trypsin theta-like n=1 Tax=Homalodisca vitripennis TaxID=197043 RepID=UPI001EEBC7E8|nr:trypsin theta-like [Homalodisca vitripennis]